ncbi:hypothetical protein BH09VER1_BH09VER1_42550 [soil metagenome]
MLGMLIQNFLPEHHLKPESKDAVKLGAGLIATMSALVLGILVGSAKTSFDTINANVTQGGARFIYLDRLLAEYGPETKDVRRELKKAVENLVMLIWPEQNAYPEAKGGGPDQISYGIEGVSKMIRNLPQDTPDHTILRTQALQVDIELKQYRWVVLEQSQNTLSRPFLLVLLFWLTTLNMTYGLFAPRNATVISVLLACALSVSGALFLIVEMDRPLEGWLKVSSAPFHEAMQFIGK